MICKFFCCSCLQNTGWKENSTSLKTFSIILCGYELHIWHISCHHRRRVGSFILTLIITLSNKKNTSVLMIMGFQMWNAETNVAIIIFVWRDKNRIRPSLLQIAFIVYRSTTYRNCITHAFLEEQVRIHHFIIDLVFYFIIDFVFD